MDPGAPGPNAGRRERPWDPSRTTSRLRRRAPAIEGSADRSNDPSVTSAAHRRTWVAPRKEQRPFVPEETNLVVSDSQGHATMTDPLSLSETKRLASTADTILLRATRTADLETPIGAFLRLDDGVTPAYLLESVEGGERLGRYSFLGLGPRRLLEVADGVARTTARPVGVTTTRPTSPSRRRRRPTRWRRCAPSSRAAAWFPSTGCRASPAAPSARSATTRSRPSSRPCRSPTATRCGPDRRLRDGPGHRLRPPHPHAVGDRVAAHRCARS